MTAGQFQYEDLLPPWPTSFPEQLAAIAESQTLFSKGLTLRTYSTQDFLAPHPRGLSANKVIERTWDARVEVLSALLKSPFQQVGLRFPVSIEALLPDALNLFRRINKLLEFDKSVYASIESLVKAVHIIESERPDYDCSYSDPKIPFSIFISIPEHNSKNRELRVLEAVVHECMHLQLSLFELKFPLVRAGKDEATWYSPWKRSRRRMSGILHGMYVFHVIAYFYSGLIKSGVLNGNDTGFARRRLGEIKDELVELRGVEQSLDLSPVGIRIAQAILTRSYD